MAKFMTRSTRNRVSRLSAREETTCLLGHREVEVAVRQRRRKPLLLANRAHRLRKQGRRQIEASIFPIDPISLHVRMCLFLVTTRPSDLISRAATRDVMAERAGRGMRAEKAGMVGTDASHAITERDAANGNDSETVSAERQAKRESMNDNRVILEVHAETKKQQLHRQRLQVAKQSLR